VTVNNLSGTRDRYLLDALPTNAPTIGINPGANLVNRIIFRLMDSRPGVRQLHPISTLGVPSDKPVTTPDLILFRADPSLPRVDEADFRNELALSNYPDRTLKYDILVKGFDDSDWQRLGAMNLTEDAVSEGGDKRLHFWIPQDVPNQN